MPEQEARPRRVRPEVAVLTGGGDRPYALGLATALAADGVAIDFIGSDDLRAPEVCDNPNVNFLNLRGDQRPDRHLTVKVAHLLLYYLRLFWYAVTSRAPVFHVLWNNKVEWFDRTCLMLLYRLCRKRVVLTLHNVNREARDGRDNALNRLTLRIQYGFSHHLFVHTPLMKQELETEYNVPAQKVTVIPFPINDTVPDTALTAPEARRRLGLTHSSKVLLFFGNIAPYKGLHYLIEAMASVTRSIPDCRLVVAGRPKPEAHWADLHRRVAALGLQSHVIEHIKYVSDEDTEMYFKAADVLVLPYVHVFQSGVLFLAYRFGLPAVVTDTGSLRDYVFDSVTGMVCAPRDADALARCVERYFASDLYRHLETHRHDIRRIGQTLYSWDAVSQTTIDVYRLLTRDRKARRDSSTAGTAVAKARPEQP
jgi:D-inositol-3-phosphate glycosyltransferase